MPAPSPDNITVAPPAASPKTLLLDAPALAPEPLIVAEPAAMEPAAPTSVVEAPVEAAVVAQPAVAETAVPEAVQASVTEPVTELGTVEPIVAENIVAEPVVAAPVVAAPVVAAPVVAAPVVAEPVAQPTVVAAPVVQPVVAPVAASVAPVLAAPASLPVDSGQRVSWWRGMSAAGRWGVGSAATLLGLTLIAGGVATGMYTSWRGANRIAPNVSIQGVPVGDMTPTQAKAALRKRFGTLKVRFETPEKTYTQFLNQMGGRVLIDQAVWKAFQTGRSGSLPANALAVWKARSEPRRLALGMKWDKKTLRRRMAMVSGQYFKKPTDARLRFAEADLVVVPDQSGRAINAGATLTSLQKRYRIGQDLIPATIEPVRAKVTARDLDGRNVLLGSYSTDFDSGLWGRTRNIHTAAASIDGLVMMPGEKFSFNSCTGERTWDKGYRMGHIFADRGNGAEVIDGLAGGVCQVSSTVFNAVRKTNNKLPPKVFLRINEHNHHSLPVTYVPSGLDATVAWPDKDFRFTNTLGYPVFLRAMVSGSSLTVSVWGRVPNSAHSATTQLAQAPRATS